MKSRALRFCLILLMVGAAGLQDADADCNYSGLLRTHWQRTRKMLTAIAAAMPEEKYDFRPVKEVRSFREMLQHLVEDGIAHTGWAAGLSREESEKHAEKYKNAKTR